MDCKLPNLPIRDENSNKGTFGKILNISGSEFMTGAAYLSSVAALRVGAGYVELASHPSVLKAVSTLAPEVVLSPLDKIPSIIETSTVLLIGCGLSTSKSAFQLFDSTTNLARTKAIPTIIDADGLNILAQQQIELPEKTILTPHPKEASRLLDCTLNKILDNLETSAKQISEKYNCVTVLKTHNTIVTSANNPIYHNTTGNSALAKAGSGDVLAGVIAGLVAQKMELSEAAILGVYLHGLSGDLAKEHLTAYGVLASDTVRYIPFAIKKLLTSNI